MLNTTQFITSLANNTNMTDFDLYNKITLLYTPALIVFAVLIILFMFIYGMIRTKNRKLLIQQFYYYMLILIFILLFAIAIVVNYIYPIIPFIFRFLVNF